MTWPCEPLQRSCAATAASLGLAQLRWLTVALIAAVFTFTFSGTVLADEPAAPVPASSELSSQSVASNAPAASEEAIASAARALLQMQEQLQRLQQNIDRTRQDAEAAATRQTDALAGRLQSIEQSLSTQRWRELESLQTANRWMLGGAGIFALLACVTVVAMAWFQWRTVSKLAEITSSLPRGLGTPSSVGALGNGDPVVSVSSPVEQANLRFLGSLDRLEKRILELEAFTRPALEQATAELNKSQANGGNGHAHSDPTEEPSMSRAASLVGKGNSLLSLEKLEEALACYDEALILDPAFAEALLKKGTALEKLGKLDEAVEFYDKAIYSDNSLTVAYLLKGGIYNRQEKFAEALACYEKALQHSEQTVKVN